MALGLFALVMAGVAASSSSGLRLVTKSNGRQTATQVAVREMELLRSTPYPSLGLNAAPANNPDPDHPDNAVNGTNYTVPGGVAEPLTVFPTGSTDHGPSLEVQNNVTYEVFRYVTWVDDPLTPATTTDSKRVTLVLRWTRDAGSSRPNTFALSSIFSPGSVGWTAVSTTTTTTTAPATTTTTAPSTTTTAAPCSVGDITAPTGTIAIVAGTGAGAGYTSQNIVQLQLSATDNCNAPADLKMLLSNDGVSFSEYPFATSYTWTLSPPGNGNHTVYVKYTDQALNVSGTGTATIRVDSTKPSTPTPFTATRPNGANKDTTLSWGASTDNDTLIGYRVYKQVGTAAFTLRATLTSTGYVDTDTPSQANPKYTFYVVSYDAAGNESNATPSITVN